APGRRPTTASEFRVLWRRPGRPRYRATARPDCELGRSGSGGCCEKPRCPPGAGSVRLPRLREPTGGGHRLRCEGSRVWSGVAAPVRERTRRPTSRTRLALHIAVQPPCLRREAATVPSRHRCFYRLLATGSGHRSHVELVQADRACVSLFASFDMSQKVIQKRSTRCHSSLGRLLSKRPLVQEFRFWRSLDGAP